MNTSTTTTSNMVYTQSNILGP